LAPLGANVFLAEPKKRRPASGLCWATSGATLALLGPQLLLLLVGAPETVGGPSMLLVVLVVVWAPL